MRALRLTAIVGSAVFALYIAAFLWRFDVLSSPVRDNEHGWLGPLIRGDTHSHDIGKAYFHEGDVSSYRVFFPLCKLWLLFQGLG